MPERATIEASLLRWARETAGYSLEAAARRLQVKPERLAEWEADDGDKRPTINQLVRLAEIYRRPFSAFYLPAPPDEPDSRLHDFRQLPGDPVAELSPALTYQLRRARDRRAVAIDLLRDLGEDVPAFGLAANLDEEPDVVGARIRDFLGVSLAEQQRWREDYTALNAWRGRIEQRGALVFQASRVDVAEMRGASVFEQPLPIIIVNSKDAPKGRIFTMLHEFCHLALHRSGVCLPDEDRNRPPEDQRIEIFCNHVAGAALVPMDALLVSATAAQHPANNPEWTNAELAELAREFSASTEVVLRRLLFAGRTTQAFYAAWRQALARRPRDAEPQKIVVPPHRRALSEAGRTFVRLVLQSYYADRITLSDVADYLSVKVKHLPKIEAAIGGGPDV